MSKENIKNNYEIKNAKKKVDNKLLVLSREDFLDNKKLVDDLINTTIDIASESGKRCGTVKEVEIFIEPSSNNWDSKKVYPKGSRFE